MFHQAAYITKRVSRFILIFTMTTGGTGLGLYIARELCEANGATLDYRQPANGGACFRIVFGDQNER